MFEAYKRIFRRLGVKFRPVEADSGAIGGSFTHEFHVLADTGEDAILSCSNCEYTSNIEKTEAPQLPFAYASEPVLDLQREHFHTPGITAMEDQARAFKDEEHDGLPLDHASKFYLLRATRGDDDVGRRPRPAKRPRAEPRQAEKRHRRRLARARSRRRGRASRRSDAPGSSARSISDVPTYVDRSLEGAFNLTCGANKDGYHHFGFKPDRDLPGLKGFYDLRMAREGDRCTRCASGQLRGVSRHRSRTGLQAGNEILGVDVVHLPRRARQPSSRW